MKLSAKLIDIANRGVLLHSADARSIRVRDGDRVQVTNVGAGKTAQAHVDTTGSLIPEGTLGVYRPLNAGLALAEGDSVEVRGADRPASLAYIKKKMDGERFTKDETFSIVKDIVDDTLSPGEVTAYVAASYIHGLDMDEVEYLTRAMVETGDQLRFSTRPIVDKHSIGGVPGNKISLLIVPIIAASGLKIPKTSSRAITGAGGTADLMEVVAPVAFSADEVQTMTEKVGGVIVWGGATNIAPADDRIITHEYPLKIDARGQMLASVMAKKLAVGADLVVIDIPVGKYTKIADIQEGRKMAREFMELGDRLNMRVECALSYGESLVGHTIGPVLEVQEALAVLEGKTEPNSLIQKSLSLAGIALEMSGKAAPGQGFSMAEDLLKSGKALDKFKQIIEIQGGDAGVTSESLTAGEHQFVVRAPQDGYVIELNNRSLITIARAAGSPLDHGAGIVVHAKKGSRVEKGDPILTLYADRAWRLQSAIEVARTLMPVVVEGMILEHIPSGRWI
ncbi:thymidine phosphorylase [Methanoculleus taiwanensis]|uniref:AMP phosphorylase n=1 Tax=Methanoculleus taiwanensis TaxID=1550565 RepID=A0A498H142_9EURY|nr:AMP phosphorylase [Methanoculleus taiwanensis]RXE55740.1 thymidine phosphorylase [Methanoculleus taiwanensis]